MLMSSRLCLLLLVAVFSNPLYAAPSVEDAKGFLDGEGTKSSENWKFSNRTQALPLDETSDTGPFQAKCWQNGVLIVDESNWRMPLVNSRHVAMKAPGRQQYGLYLVDFYGTFCEIRSIAAPSAK